MEVRTNGGFMTKALRRRRRDGGAVSVEFVFIVPILLVLIFGIIQFAYYFFQLQQGAFAAREAARQAAVGTQTCGDLVTLVVDRVGTPSTVTVTITVRDGDTGSIIADGTNITTGDNATVLVQFQAADFGFPFIPYPNNAAVSEDAQTRIENVTTNTAGYAGCTGSG